MKYLIAFSLLVALATAQGDYPLTYKRLGPGKIAITCKKGTDQTISSDGGSLIIECK